MFAKLVPLSLCFAVLGSASTVDARSALEDSTDIKIRNSSSVDAIGAENTVYVHPADSRIVLVSQNNGTVQGIGAWVSQDAGKTWSGDNSAAGGTSNGDPAAVIRRAVGSDPVRYIVGTLANKDVGPPNLDSAQQVVYKDNPTSLTWTRVTVVDNTQGMTDKNHLWVDNHPSSSNVGLLYAGWSNIGKRAEAAVSENGGLTWIRRANLDLNAVRAEWGVNLQVAIDATHRGDIYAVWAETDADPADESKKFFFNKSSDAGQTWGTAAEAYNLNGKGYARRAPLSGKDMGTNSAPTMTVDSSGNIYVVWTQKRADGSSTDAEVYMLKSSNQGSTWTVLGSSPKRVNQDSGTSDQWQSWVTWDDCTDAVVVVYFDSRADSTKADTYIAASYDGGSTFQEVKVNGVSWSGDSGGGFAGDYIGIAARDGIVYPVWSDDRETTGVFKVYISPIYLWGVTQSSVAHSVVSNPGLSLTVTVTWNTNLSATGTDYLVLTSPTNVVYTGTTTGSGTSHSVAKTCTCEPGDWKYIVKSTRPGFTSRGSDEKTIRIYIARAADRMVGVVPTDGSTVLVKQFVVNAGTTITAVCFENNDGATTFPEVALVHAASTRLTEGTIVASASNVRPGSGLSTVTWPTPVTVSQAGTYLVAIRFPSGPGKQGVGQGPAIGTNDVTAPTGSYVAGSANETLVALGTDLAISLVSSGGGAGKVGEVSPEPPSGGSGQVDGFLVRTHGGRVPVTLVFTLATPADIVVGVYDVSGRLVREMTRAPMTAGSHHDEWDGRDDSGRAVAAGIYFIRLQRGHDVLTQKVAIAR